MQKKYDVAVVGGGPGGIGAAVAAAQEGAETLLIERYGFLGGMATAGLVNPFMSYRSRDEKLTTAVFNELLRRLEKRNALDRRGRIFDDEEMKLILDEMTGEYGIDLLLHSLFTTVDLEGSHIRSISTEGKSGRIDVEADIFIDATGDGDLAARAGEEIDYGRSEDDLCQPHTLCFRMGGVEPGLQAGELRSHLTEILDDAKERGEVEQPRENVLLFATLQSTVWHFNTTRVLHKKATSTTELTAAELEGRRQVAELVELFCRESPYFSDAYLIKMAAQIGIRESRRVIGEYILDADDVLGARRFEDGIARSNYNIDIHNPAGTGTVLKKIQGDYYEIPYRCLVPNNIDNLLVGSRCISATHEAHSSLRIMPVVAGIGEAAGRAAAWAVESGIPPSEIDGSALKENMFGAES